MENVEKFEVTWRLDPQGRLEVIIDLNGDEIEVLRWPDASEKQFGGFTLTVDLDDGTVDTEEKW